MENIELENISISEYAKMLRSGNLSEKCKQIELHLNKSLNSVVGGMDLHLFQMSKDLLIFQCRLAFSIFDFDEPMQKFYQRKVDELRKEIERKTKTKEAASPYKSFLNWILAVEKYLGFSIDRNNDLLYLVEATKQMIGYYEAQKNAAESQQAKNRK